MHSFVETSRAVGMPNPLLLFLRRITQNWVEHIGTQRANTGVRFNREFFRPTRTKDYCAVTPELLFGPTASSENNHKLSRSES